MSMQEVSYQCKDRDIGIENKKLESTSSAKLLSLSDLLDVSNSISNTMHEIPASYMFSSTILQFISTVYFRFYFLIA